MMLALSIVVISHAVTPWPAAPMPLVENHVAVDANHSLKAPRLDPALSQNLRSITFTWSTAPGYLSTFAKWENLQDQPWDQHQYNVVGGLLLGARPIYGSIPAVSQATPQQLAFAFGATSYMNVPWMNTGGLSLYDGTTDFAGTSGFQVGYNGGYQEFHSVTVNLGTFDGWMRRWACLDQDGQGNIGFYAHPFGRATISFPGGFPSHWTDSPTVWDRDAGFSVVNQPMTITYTLEM